MYVSPFMRKMNERPRWMFQTMTILIRHRQYIHIRMNSRFVKSSTYVVGRSNNLGSRYVRIMNKTTWPRRFVWQYLLNLLGVLKVFFFQIRIQYSYPSSLVTCFWSVKFLTYHPIQKPDSVLFTSRDAWF